VTFMTKRASGPRMKVIGVQAFVHGAQLKGQTNARSRRTSQDQAGPGG
jgi:hypothetical protein